MFSFLLTPRERLEKELLNAVGKGGHAILTIRGKKQEYFLSIDNDDWGHVNWHIEHKREPNVIPSIIFPNFWHDDVPNDLVEPILEDLDNIKERLRKQGEVYRESVAKRKKEDIDKKTKRKQNRESMDNKIIDKLPDNMKSGTRKPLFNHEFGGEPTLLERIIFGVFMGFVGFCVCVFAGIIGVLIGMFPFSTVFFVLGLYMACPFAIIGFLSGGR